MNDHADTVGDRIATLRFLRSEYDHRPDGFSDERAALDAAIAALTRDEPHCSQHQSFETDCLECSDALERRRAALEAGRSGETDPALPCDVRLPPATTINAGCKLSTLLHAMELRKDAGVVHFPPKAAQQQPPPVGVPEVDISIIREAAEVLSVIADTGVPLPNCWRYPMIDELTGIAAALSEQPAQLSRIEFPEGTVQRADGAIIVPPAQPEQVSGADTSDVPDDELRDQLAACREDWQRVCDAIEPGRHFNPEEVIRRLTTEQGDHSTHGRGDADGPYDSDCPCRGTSK